MSDKRSITFRGDAHILEALDYLGRKRYQQILVQIPLNILLLFRDFHLINQVADFTQRRRFGDFKLSILHIPPKDLPSVPAVRNQVKTRLRRCLRA